MGESSTGRLDNAQGMSDVGTGNLKSGAYGPIVVAIAGGSGSGKTTLAERLCDRFGSDAVVLPHDDYYKNQPNMTLAEAIAYDFDSPDALDTYLLVDHLRTLKSGLPVDVPSYNFATHARIDAARHIEPAPVIVVEGLLIMCDSELRSLFDLEVFVDVDSDVRTLRRIERDCQSRGADLSRAVKMYLDTTKSAHDRYVEPFKSTADIIVADVMNDTTLEVLVAGISALCGLS